MSEKRFSKLSSSIDYFDVWDSVEEKGYTVDEVVELLNEQQSELELLHYLISIMKEDKRFIKLIEDKRSELAFEPYSEKEYDEYRCLDKIRGKLYE